MNLFLAFIAGLLTTLSPCVLPVIPFVTASSLNKSRLGPIFLAIGLLVSFVSVSIVLSTTGFIFGINPLIIKKIAGVFLFLSGLLFLSQHLSEWFAFKLSFISSRASNTQNNSDRNVLFSEFLGGLLLGVVWTPCSGPSLGAALGLASQQGGVLKAAITLSVFGLGSIIPLILFAYGARHLVNTAQNYSNIIGIVKKVFGVLIAVFGLLIVFELDRRLESALTNILPENWLSFITKF